MSVFRGKILIIRGGAIGDFVLTLPALSALRQRFPEALLEVLGYPHIARLALAGGLANRSRSLEGRELAAFFGRNAELSEELRDYFSEFDVILSYLYDPDEIFRVNVGRCSPAQFITGPHRPDESSRLHATQVFLKPLERLAIFDADPVPRLSVEGKSLPQLDGHVLALHPGSGSESKNWPEEEWAQLLQALINSTGFNLLIVGGEAEGERLQRLAAALPPLRTRVAQSLPLTELAALLTRCHGYIGHDSGISHLAAAVGLTGLILWGQTTQEVWSPRSNTMAVLRHPLGLDRLPADDVFQRVRSLWPV